MVGVVESDHAQEFSALHARLGHRAPGAMRLIAKDLGIPWRKEYDKLVSAGWICESCQISKMPTPNRLAPRHEPLATRPFQRVYVDTIECVAQESRKKGTHPVLGKYPTQNRDGLAPVHLLIIVDELTRFSWVEPVYSKRSVDVGLAFSKWKNEQLPLSRELRARRTGKFHNEPECNREILAIHSDSGSEFTSAFDTLCRQYGVAHVASPPYTQSKNGVVEARVKLIKQLIRSYTLKLERCNSSDFANYAMFAAMQINMLRTDILGTSPYMALHGVNPNPTWLREYGDLCYIKDYRPMSPTKGRRVYLVGVVMGPTHGMRVWSPETGYTSIVHDAKFGTPFEDTDAPTNALGDIESDLGPPQTHMLTYTVENAPDENREKRGGGEITPDDDTPAPAGDANVLEQERTEDDRHGDVSREIPETSPSPRGGREARSDDVDQDPHQGRNETGEDGDMELERVPGSSTVGVQVHETPHTEQETTEQASDTTSEQLGMATRRSARSRRPPERFIGLADVIGNPRDRGETASTSANAREKFIQSIVDDATVDVTRRTYGGNTSALAVIDPVALKMGTKASTLSAWLTIGGERKDKIDVLDLCSGSKSLQRALEAAGVADLFNVISIDSDPKTNPTVVMRAEELIKAINHGKPLPLALRTFNPRIIWASPPCTSFSKANTRRTEKEKERDIKKGLKTVRACFEVVAHFKPPFWCIENPETLLLEQVYMKQWERFRHSVTYCKYGRPDQKPTSLWTNLTNLVLSDCRRPDEKCLAKAMLGRHTATAQAGPTRSADGTTIPGTPKVEAQKVPELLMITLIQRAITEFGDEILQNPSSEAKRLQAFAVNTISNREQLGQNVRDIAECSQSEIREAKQKEMIGLIERGVFEMVDVKTIERDAPSLHPVWVLKVREDNSVKARLCAGGHRQRKGENFWEISSPTPRSSSVKISLGVAATKKWQVNTADVSQAYVASDLGVLMYMRPPPEMAGMSILEGKPLESVRLKLIKSLYGAKQSGRNWHNEVSRTLQDKLKYVQNQKDPSVFYKTSTAWADMDQGPSEVILLYVDDFLHLGPPQSFETFMREMKKNYDITATPSSQKTKIWNGLEITSRADGSIAVSQVAKIREMGREFKTILDQTLSSKNHKHPEYVGENLFDPNDSIDPKTANDKELETLRTYQSMVGSAMYVATYTRFDISYALSKASRLMHCASEKHVKGMARILKYLVEHEDLELVFRGDVCTPHGVPRLFTFVDSDYAGEPLNQLDEDNLGRKSTSAVIIMAFGTAIFWKSKLQPVVATSTGEAEFRAMWLAVAETLFCIHFLHEIGYESYSEPLVPVFCDSNVGVAHAKRDGLSWLEGTKQYETQLSCTYQHCRHGNIVPIKIEGKENPADLLSKSHIGTVDKCESTRKRISGQETEEPFDIWIRNHIIKNFDGTSMMQDKFVSKSDLLTKYGL